MTVTGGAPVTSAEVRSGVAIDVGGLPLALAASDSERAEAVASLFRHGTRVEGPAVATVSFDAEPVAVPSGVPTAGEPNLELWIDAGRLVARTRVGLGAVATSEGLRVGGTAPDLAREFRFVALLGLTYLLARHDRHLLHGAAIGVGAATDAVVVLGPTGAGKSTLAFAAHARGLPVVADDALVLRRAPDGPWVRGVPRPIAVAADVAADLGGRPVPDDPRNRTELPPGSTTGAEHRVVALAVCAADAQGREIAPLAGVDAFRAVLRASASVADPEVRPALFALAGDLARLPSVSLPHGPDPATAVADASAQLDVLVRVVADARLREP